MCLMIHDLEQRGQVISREQGRCPERRLNIGDHECRGQTFARCISNDHRQAVILQGYEIVAIAAERPELTAARAIVQRIASRRRRLHKRLLHIAGQCPVLANVHHHFVGLHFLASTGMSVLSLLDRHRVVTLGPWPMKSFRGRM